MLISKKEISKLKLTDKLFQIDYVEEYWSFKLNKVIHEKHSFKHALPEKINDFIPKDIIEKAFEASINGKELANEFSKIYVDLDRFNSFDKNNCSSKDFSKTTAITDYTSSSIVEIAKRLVIAEYKKTGNQWSSNKIVRISIHIADNIVLNISNNNRNIPKICFANILDNEE